jgi:sugar lactone lactonase YvrE
MLRRQFMTSQRIGRPAFALLSFLLCSGLSTRLGAQSLQITHLAGTPGGGGFADGTGASARFNRLIGATADSAGNVYVADSNNEVIRKITPAGVVTTIAGAPNKAGSADGVGGAARFNFPQGIAADAQGNLFVADSSNATIRKVTPDGTVTTLAGSPGKTGSADGTGASALFFFPSSIATDLSGNVYVTDSDSDFQCPSGAGFSTIRKISPNGTVTTLAGSATVRGYADGTGGAALFDFGSSGGLATDAAGNIYVADTDNNVIRKVSPAGVVSTIAGTAGFPCTPVGFGTKDGTGPAAQFESLTGIAISTSGDLFVADGEANTIRRITPAGVVTTLAGGPNSYGLVDGTGGAARFDSPQMLGSDGVNLYVPDTSNNAVRKIVVATAAVTTLAGGSIQESDSIDGVGTAARFVRPAAVGTDGTNLYVCDTGFLNSNFSATIRKVVLATSQVTTLAGTAGAGRGSTDGLGSAASFYDPESVATDGTNLYVADAGNSTIRKIVIGTGQVTTLAGTAGATGSTDGIGSAARFNGAEGVATDGTNIFVADSGNSTIRQIVIATGQVTTIAGVAGKTGSADGIGIAALFNDPESLATDGSNIYVTDSGNNTIRRIVIATGQVTTLAGTPGTTGSSDGIGAAARFNGPVGVTTDGISLYVTDYFNETIRVIDLATGQVTTHAGLTGATGAVDAAGSDARFFGPIGIVFVGNAVYIADSVNFAIRKGVCTGDPPVSPAATPIGDPTGPVTGIDYLNVTWSPPASGLTPNGYDWAINGDPFTSDSTTSATAPPRGSNDPVTLHVRSRACSPEVAGAPVDSPTYSPAPPVASFTFSVSGQKVTVTDTSQPLATSWLWLWGDGTFDTSQAPPAHTYTTSGNYPIVLIATNGAGSSSSTQRAQTLGISVQLSANTLMRFDSSNPERQVLGGVRVAARESTWLRIAPVGNEDVTVYLRFLGPDGKLAMERRLAPSSGTESVYDLGAYGLRGIWTLELVSAHPLEAFLEERQDALTRKVGPR